MSPAPILWIHGFPLSARIYEPQKPLGGFAPDLAGFGGAPPPAGAMSMDKYADELFAYLDGQRVATAVVAGLSMGGYVALAMARKDPSRIAGLILIDTRETADPEEARKKRFETIAAVRREGIEPVVRDMLPKLLSRNAPQPMVQQVESILRGASREGVMAALEAMADRPDSSSLLPQLEIPALVVVGSEDVIAPPADSERMASRIPRATLEVIAGAGHLSNFEKPAEFNEAVRRFLATEMQR